MDNNNSTNNNNNEENDRHSVDSSEFEQIGGNDCQNEHVQQQQQNGSVKSIVDDDSAAESASSEGGEDGICMEEEKDNNNVDDGISTEMERQLKAKDKLVAKANIEIEALRNFFGQFLEHCDKPKIFLATLPLNARCSAAKSDENLQILHSGLKVVCKKTEYNYYMFPDTPFDAEAARIGLSIGISVLYYFEVQIHLMFESDDVCIGFAPEADYSMRYIKFCSDGELLPLNPSKKWEKYGTGFKKGDVVGCGLILSLIGGEDREEGTKKAHAFLTVNGIAYKHVPINADVREVWPFATLGYEGSVLEANFGQRPGKPFKYVHWRSCIYNQLKHLSI